MEEYDENGIRFKWKWILQHCHSDRFFIIFFFAFVLIVTMLHKKRKVLVLFPIACESTRITRTEQFFMKNHNVHEKYTFIGRYRTVNEFCRLSGGAINKWQNTRTCKNTLFSIALTLGAACKPRAVLFSAQFLLNMASCSDGDKGVMSPSPVLNYWNCIRLIWCKNVGYSTIKAEHNENGFNLLNTHSSFYQQPTLLFTQNLIYDSWTGPVHKRNLSTNRKALLWTRCKDMSEYTSFWCRKLKKKENKRWREDSLQLQSIQQCSTVNLIAFPSFESALRQRCMESA